MPWTDEQQNAIAIRDKNILVSAAAGSGKTAVLVERICKRVLDEKNPADIDEFLVVTFTNAAAGQMRDKIAEKLWSELEKNPDNEHLMRQTVLINRADITTIDSFCLKIVKEYFSLLDVDADFSIGDKGEILLLKADVLDELFEEMYNHSDEKKREEFFTLVNVFGGDRDDTGLKELVTKIYNQASGYPKPDLWLDEAKKTFMVENSDELKNMKWMKDFFSYEIKLVSEAYDLAREAKMIAEAPNGPYKNIELAQEDIEQLQTLMEQENLEKLREKFSNISWGRLKTCKGDEFDIELVERFKEIRNSYKNLIKSLALCRTKDEELLGQIKKMGEYLVPLIELVECFMDKYAREKKERRVMEFSDIEHLAYKLVCDGYKTFSDDKGNEITIVLPTEIGESIGERYKEIYIDEYQDSNFLQEDILTAVSGQEKGNYNLFMVGDVKQSIYRFRMARPDLFIGKYNRYTPYCEDCTDKEVKLELKNNFRSRKVVLDAVNYFFYQLMGEDMGGIAYTDLVALVPTKVFEEPKDNENISISTELLVGDICDAAEDVKDDEEQEKDKLILEAEMIAQRIKELLNIASPINVYDEKKGEYRNACYRDIVILLRSLNEYGDAIYNTLAEHGIPAYIDESKGYFEATEIRVVMSLLSVIDNSRQDIPLSAVLLSPIVGINENELARIISFSEKNIKEKQMLYDRSIYYAQNASDDVADRLNKFFDMLGELKKEKTALSISQLILKLYDMTGYYHYACAMPSGDRRKSNLDALVDKAKIFENGVYKGLFNFLRYVDKLKMNEVDFGESGMPGENDDVVHIMTMHKSKGLEYPIVFVSGLGKQFNTMDFRQNIQVNSDYYITSKLINLSKRYRMNSVMRDAIILLAKQEAFAEELRILYVAMTRAKEKLILTGCVKNYDSYSSRLYEGGYDKILLPYDIRNTQKGFLYWILSAMKRYGYYRDNKLTEAVIDTKIIPAQSITVSNAKAGVEATLKIEDLISRAVSAGKNKAYEEYKKAFDYIYPYDCLTKIKSKMPISEIKKMKAFDGSDFICSESSQIDNKEEVKQASNELSGAERGTVIHKFMELLDFSSFTQDNYIPGLEGFLNRLVLENVFTEKESRVINLNKINNMLMSDLGQRMIKAARDGKLKKEQQFSIGIPAKEIYKNIDSDDIVIVQGIIDAFFYEGDQIVLMDYKTDRADEEALIGHYHAQLKYYASTLESLTKLKVKEKLIYSFYKDKVIEVK